MFDSFFEEVEHFDSIYIFRHVFADGDALGSQFGLKEWVKHNYPNKQVYALGKDSTIDFFPKMDQVEKINPNSLAIVLDTANRERIDDQRYGECAKIVKIDHHPIVDEYGDINFAYPKASATCEVLTKILKRKGEITPLIATYLYAGLLTDTQKFSISSVTSETLELAAYLAQFQIDIPSINQNLFNGDYQSFLYETYLRSKVVYEKGVAYVIADEADYQRFNLTFSQAKEKVFVMNHIKEFKIYILFTQNPEMGGLYNGSIRSKNTVINDLAVQYRGGGHAFASGVKQCTKEEIKEIVEKCQSRLLQSE